MVLIFWMTLIIILYTYLGYPVMIALLARTKQIINPTPRPLYRPSDLPEITLVIAAFNEGDILEEKISNTFQLEYPVDRKRVYFVTDGSTDNSAEILRKYPGLTVFHQPERKGKNAAVNRVMPHVRTPVVVFSDANTRLNPPALQLLARHYKDSRVGAVAGEKRVSHNARESAAGSGEGAYWKYESKLKQWDSELNTVVGAAGELFSLRTSLFEAVPAGVLIEDFRLSMNIAKKGYRVVYEPEAYATETGSASIEEERKRKVRIAAGGLLEVWHFRGLLNFFRYGLLSFQFISHRMLRWTLAPLSLLLLLITNVMLALTGNLWYVYLLLAQAGFYLFALLGFLLRNRKLRFRVVFVPYYFLFMNISVYQGLLRLLRGKQTVVWEKARRA